MDIVYTKYALDLDKIEPVVALSCRLYYCTKLIEAKKKSEDSVITPNEKAEIRSLLDLIEEGYKRLRLSRNVRRKILIRFCDKLFTGIKEEELLFTTPTLLHAIQFNTVADLIDLLNQFGEIPNEWKERKRYCKCKAITMLENSKKGKEPPIGRPMDTPKVFDSILIDYRWDETIIVEPKKPIPSKNEDNSDDDIYSDSILSFKEKSLMVLFIALLVVVRYN
jgi:hypothetical protein